MTTNVTRNSIITKTEAIRAIILATEDTPVIFTTGYTCRIARGIADRPNHFYMTGSMGVAAPLAAGVALATDSPAVVVDGDGSLLMNPAAMVTAASIDSLRLIHVLLDDGAYASTGGQATGSNRVDIRAWAKACAYLTISPIGTPSALVRYLRSSLRHCDTPVFIRCEVSPSPQPVPGRIDADLASHARRFATHVCASHSVKVQRSQS